MSKKPPSTSPTRAMQWAGLIIVTILTVISMIIAYEFKNPLYLVPSIPLGFIWSTLQNSSTNGQRTTTLTNSNLSIL